MAIHAVAKKAAINTTIQKTKIKLATTVKLTALLLSLVILFACSDAAKQSSEFNEPASSTVNQTRISSPENVIASTNNGVVTLSWTDSATNNTDNTTNNSLSYNIYWNATGNVTTSDILIESVTSPHIIEDLTIGETYFFIVTAQNIDQQSNPSYEIFAVAPLPVLTSITLEPENHAVISGNNVQYAAKGNYSDGSIIDLTTAVDWQSDNIDTTIIDDATNKGLATTIVTGITNITAVDPISSISGSTTLTGQLDHNTFDPTLSCNNSSCHQLPGAHMGTSSICEACHTLGSESLIWSPVPISSVDHNQVMGGCFDCHDGVVAGYKNNKHAITTDNCEKCHIISKWFPVSSVDHNEIFGICVDCHDGTISSGKTATHILSSNNCNACHNLYPATWSPILSNAVNHNETIGTCFSCHNTVIATGKSLTHTVTSNLCADCHNVNNWQLL